MDTEKTETPEFTVPAERFAYFQARMAELAKRAAKIGVAFAIGYELVRTFTREYTLVTGAKYTRTFHTVTVYGEAPKFEGWSLRGRFDYQAIPGAVMRAMVPGFECPPEFHDVESTRCDACKAERVRNDVFLLQHEDGRYVVVGRSCIKDYLGHVSPAHIASMAEIMREVGSADDEEGGFWGGGGPSAYPLVDVLAYAAYSVRKYGWASSKEYRSTKDGVWNMFHRPTEPKVAREWDEMMAEVAKSERDWSKAANCQAWLSEQEPSGDYMANLVAISQAGAVTDKSLGLAVSAIVAYDRAMEREVKRRERDSKKGFSDYVGEPKKRMQFDGMTVESVRYWEGTYGVTTFVKFRDAADNVVVWKASNSPDLEVGDVVNFKATVKAHTEYRGEKQTQVARAAKIEMVTPGPAREEANDAA